MQNENINISFSSEELEALMALAHKNNRQISVVAHDLIVKALELEEDLYFSRLSERRLEESNDLPRISHDDAWK